MFKTVVKDQMFYNQFEYCIKFRLAEVSCLRTLDHACIDDLIERRKAWRRDSVLRNYMGDKEDIISDSTVEHLHILADLLLNTTVDFKLVVSGFTGYVYTNDLSLIGLISKLPGVSNSKYSQAIIGRPKNTIQLKDPKYLFRSYFKTSKLTDEGKIYLRNFLANHSTVRISPGLQQWIDTKFTRTQDYFFVDYNDPKWTTMLSLVQPGLIRKTLQIIPAK